MTTHLRARCSALAIVTFVFTMIPVLLPAGENGKARPAAPAAGTSRFSLDEWRAEREAFRDALDAQSSAEKVEKLQAFQAKYPNYEYARSLKLMIADAQVESGQYDPEAVTRTLIEGLDMPGWGGCSNVIYWAQRYAVKNQLSLENARRVLEAAKESPRRDPRRTGKKKAVGPEGPWEEYERRRCDYGASLAEGEILLARGDAAGALPVLQRAENRAFLAGNDLLMVDEKGENRGVLLTGESDALDLALAKAYTRTGDLPAAREHLARLSFHAWDAEYRKDVQTVSKELGWKQPAGREWTTDPVQAAPFEFKDLEGKRVKYDDYRGKVILLNFWSTT
jgi:hypothetical protein